MKKVSLKELLEAGCHFGHKASRWNPLMGRFIFEKRDNIHIIDLGQTKAQLEKAAEEVKKIAKNNGIILLLGTKRQSKQVILEAAEKAGLPYIIERWIGGFITNWGEVKKNIEKMNNMEDEEKKGVWKKLPKHEQVKKRQALVKLKRVYGGVSALTKRPDALYIVDVKKEYTAAKEAKMVGLLSVGICDTNSDPRSVTIPVPANDDAVKSIKYITDFLAEAYLEGKLKVKSEK